MKVEFLEIEGLAIITPQVFTDDRGYFLETFHYEKFKQVVKSYEFVQDNESASALHTLRGLHFQAPPYDQGKLVRVIKGKALDVAVDIRKSSPTYGRHFVVLLDDIKKQQFWIPPGFAHGFLSIEENTIFAYKCTAYYHRESEYCIRWDDPQLAIDWQVKDPLISEKDKKGLPFHLLDSPFL